MWRRRDRRSRVRLTSQSTKKRTTTTERTLKVTQDPKMYTTTHGNSGNNGDTNNIDVTPRGSNHPKTVGNAHMYTTQGKFLHVNGVNVTPRTYTTTQSNDNSTQAINGIAVTQRELTHPTTRRNANMSTTQGSILQVQGVNATPATNTTTISNADSTQRVNGIDVPPHDNTAAPCDTEATKGTIRGCSSSPMMDGSVSS